jgi:hypothetical protein
VSDMFGKRSFESVVHEALTSLGGRAKRAELVDQVRHTLSVAEFETWKDRAFSSAVVRAAKSSAKGAGSESVYSVGEELAPLRLFTVEEFTDKARHLARLHRANRDQVWRLAEVCENVHGRSFDAQAILAEVEGA